MTPYYDHNGITIYHGDCREILPGVANRSIDLVLADPPYEHEAHTKARRVRSGGGVGVLEIPFSAMDETLRSICGHEIGRLARRWVLTFCQVEAAMSWRSAYERGSLEYLRTCIWVKPDGAPQFTGDRPGMGYETLVAMHAPGTRRWNGGGRHGVFTYCVGRHPDHPTQKPLPLIRDLIGLFSDPGDLILDPFMGSGTTLRAAKDLGRRAIGIERDERYCAVAVERLSQEILDFSAG